jgi:hypothetical protein
MVLRGTRLAETLYDDPALRTYTDIDLLVQRQHLADVKTMARDLGYLPIAGEFQEEFFEHHHYHLRYESAMDGVPLEIHWSLDPPLSIHRIDYKGVFRRARPFRLGGAPALGPAPEDDLLLLTVHLAKHATCLRGLSGPGLTSLCLKESLLLWILDVERFLTRSTDLDWDAVVDRARSWEVAGPVVTALNLVAQVLGTAVPKAPRRELERAAHRGTAEQLLGRMARGEGPLSRRFRSMHGALLRSPGAFGLYRIPEVMRYLFPPRRWAARHCPLPRWPLPIRRAAHTVRTAGQMGRLAGSVVHQAASTRQDRLTVQETPRSAVQG